MSLRDKTLLTVGLTILIVLSIIYATSRLILLGSYVRLEDQYARQDLNRATQTFSETLNVMDTIDQDWTASEEAYQYAQTRDPQYIQQHFTKETFNDLGLNFIVITDTQGRIIYNAGFDTVNNRWLAVPQDLVSQIKPGSPLLPVSGPESSSKGVLMLPEDPALVVARPILNSQKQGPVHGVIILGRYLSQQEIANMAEADGVDMKIQALNGSAATGELPNMPTSLSPLNPVAIQPINSNLIGGYTLINDLYGKPALLLTVSIPRSIYQQGRSSLSYFMFLLFSVGGVFALISIMLLERQVLTRLGQLTKRVLAIGQSGDLSERIPTRGRDELSTLAGSINDMLERLQQATQALTVSEDRFRKLAETSAAIIFIHQNGKFQYINPMGSATFGFNQEQLRTMGFEDLIPEEKRKGSMRFLNLLEEGKALHVRFETPVDTGIGDQRYLEITATPFEYEGHPAVIGTAYDITERKLAEEQMRYLSNHDSLSGLYNRAFFEEELIRLERGRNLPISMVIIDIDGLKPANDTRGHAAGDELIRRTARVLKDVFRAEDVIARIGGDEFAVLLPGAGKEEAALTKERIHAQLEVHNRHHTDLPLNFSVGIATGEVAGPLTALMQKADELMYQEKINKRNHYIKRPDLSS